MPSRLGAVERHIGVLEQAVRIGGIARRQRNADARADSDLVAFEFIGFADDFEQPLRQRADLFGLRYVALQNRKFVAAEAGDGVMFAQQATQPVGHGLQQQIAEGMAERIVHGFEIVEIDAKRCGREAVALHACQHIVHAQAQKNPVRQRCQRIVMRHECDARFRALALSNVGCRDEEGLATVIDETARENGDIDDAAIRLAVLPGLAGLGLEALIVKLQQVAGDGVVVDFGNAHAEQRLAIVAIMLDSRVVHRQHALIVDGADEHGHGIAVEQKTERFFAAFQIGNVDA